MNHISVYSPISLVTESGFVIEIQIQTILGPLVEPFLLKKESIINFRVVLELNARLDFILTFHL